MCSAATSRRIFQGEFSSGGGVPVLRADLAGYGASIWSEWLDPNAKGTAIIKVQFETVVGRTAYEVVKAQTTLYPHGVRLVRTVTIARQNAGWVQRTDSGWVAATPGIYNFPNAAVPAEPRQSRRGRRRVQRPQRARVRDRRGRRLHLSPRAVRRRCRHRPPA